MTRTMHRAYVRRATAIVAAGALVSLGAPLAAQQKAVQSGSASKTTLDRTRIPAPAKPADLRVPTWTKTTLGRRRGTDRLGEARPAARLVHDQLRRRRGAVRAGGQDGLASIVAAMLTEGTTHRTGDQISNDLQSLGTFLNAGVGSESGRSASHRPPTSSAKRSRSPPICSRTRRFRRTRSTASRAGSTCRCSRTATAPRESPVSCFRRCSTRRTIRTARRSRRRRSRPSPATTSCRSTKRTSNRAARSSPSWATSHPRRRSRPSSASSRLARRRIDADVRVPGGRGGEADDDLSRRQAGRRAIDVRHRRAGPARDTPDYYALRVMNEMLGVLFQSRLNHNIREVKGYSYGVFSSFAFGKGPGAFRAGGDIVTAKSDSALIEFMKELRDIRGPRPPTDDELAQAKASLVQSLPETFASVGGINGSIASLYVQGLPEDYYQQFARRRERGDEGRRRSRGQAVHRSRPPGDRDRRRSLEDRSPARGDEDRADRAPRSEWESVLMTTSPTQLSQRRSSRTSRSFGTRSGSPRSVQCAATEASERLSETSGSLRDDSLAYLCVLCALP